jgi:serine/threonine protein phosphatase 1
MLGDFIDAGPASYECLQLAFDLQQEYGADKVTALKGNHEVQLLEFLSGKGKEWAGVDDYGISGTFLSDDQKEKLGQMKNPAEIRAYLRESIKKNHKELLSWLKKLPYSKETETQIFVHAGVNEDIPEEDLDFCVIGTPEEELIAKYPPSTGHFFKDIIAGHTAAATLANDPDFSGIYFDGESHYYIDGATPRTNRVLCLAYDEKWKKYYELMDDGSLKLIKKEKV